MNWFILLLRLAVYTHKGPFAYNIVEAEFEILNFGENFKLW